MRHFFTLVMIVLSTTVFSQAVIITETFPANKFNTAGSGGMSGTYNGDLAGWSIKSSSSSIVQVDDVPSGGTTQALRFASGSGSTNNPRTDTATSPNLNLQAATCTIIQLGFRFDWYVSS